MIQYLDNEVGWFVGEQFFNNKIKALEASDWKPAKIQFRYREQFLATTDLSQNPVESWEELLMMSCLNLRESCQYLSLWFSGGSDSLTVLDVFSKYNIRLDELIFYDKKYNPYDYYNQEARFVLKEMETFKLIQPWCKLTVIDVDYNNAKTFYKKHRDHWIYQPYTTIRYAKNMRYNLIQNNPSLAKQFERPDRIDIIGREKPKLILDDGKWFLVFYDCIEYDTYLNGFHHFYWDDLKILAKQAHMAAEFFESLPNFDQQMLHRIQGNQAGDIYIKYCQAIGRKTPQDLWIAAGMNKCTGNRLNSVYEGRHLENFSSSHDPEVFSNYWHGFQYIQQNFDLGNNHDAIGNIIGKPYFLKKFQSEK
jgi:hypothetical protein